LITASFGNESPSFNIMVHGWRDEVLPAIMSRWEMSCCLEPMLLICRIEGHMKIN